MNWIILNTAYFPNIQYLSKFISFDKVFIEINDTYSKQTYRNRCNISTANGLLPLSVPIVKNNKTKTKDILIDYSEQWQKKQSRAILSAYKNSAFYDYYYPEFEKFFIKKEKFLLDLNIKVLDVLLDCYDIKSNYSLTEEYIVDTRNIDFRDKIHPKLSKNAIDKSFVPANYYQVFYEKNGFIANLSYIDLLFNEGPVDLQILRKCINPIG